MDITRSIAAGPLRAVEHTLQEFAGFTAALMRARGHADPESVRKAVEQTFPLLRILITTRRFRQPGIVIGTGDMRVALNVGYEPGSAEHLDVPDMSLLDPLTPDTVVAISYHVTDEVGASLRRGLDAATTKVIAFDLVVPEARPEPESREEKEETEAGKVQDEENVPAEPTAVLPVPDLVDQERPPPEPTKVLPVPEFADPDGKDELDPRPTEP